MGIGKGELGLELPAVSIEEMEKAAIHSATSSPFVKS
jgi:hypothetical protein